MKSKKKLKEISFNNYKKNSISFARDRGMQNKFPWNKSKCFFIFIYEKSERTDKNNKKKLVIQF